MLSRLSFRPAIVALPVALVLAACASEPPATGRTPATPATGRTPVPSPSQLEEIPANLTDEWLDQAFLPEFRGARPGQGQIRPAHARVAEKVDPMDGFIGSPKVRGDGCVRWAGGLRHAAREFTALDPKARIAGTSYAKASPGKLLRFGEALLVARPAMLDAMAKDPLARCRRATARIPTGFDLNFNFDGPSESKITAYSWFKFVAEPLPKAASLGEWSSAYRWRRADGERTWIKEVRFGPYLLQVWLTGDPPFVVGSSKPDRIDLAQLDAAAAAAYEHARTVLTGPSPKPSITFRQTPTPEATPS